ncbi:hypothetical protein HYALB_00009806 [Hymenoscyphus albidus]|uniref:Aminoglycoside phosphotransferase domain-containing protein n=1 Tax=Hymenoscyphus albidus TaxID=595503 RepID=A0A9N9LJ07_9HELO|nr:hypothetical protein HYALB_00009806 [Hymenoscyphus albidus]
MNDELNIAKLVIEDDDDDAREDLDNLAWDKNDEAWEVSQARLLKISTSKTAASIAGAKFDNEATFSPPVLLGGFNILFKIEVEGMASGVFVQLPCHDVSQFQSEKSVYEGATARYVKQYTKIPTPKVFYYGDESELGPFMILERISDCGLMSLRICAHRENPDIPAVLDPDISESLLEKFYKKAAFCLLRLSRLSFNRIGSLSEGDDNTFSINGRPLCKNMNNMLQLANIPRSVLPLESKTYSTADEWYVALAEMHIAQLIFQHNDLVARQIFRGLAKDRQLSIFGFSNDKWSAQSETWTSKLSPAPSNVDSFTLWADDLRPGNMLIDDSDELAAVIDWELTYAAPTQFALDSPGWLLLEVPEMWNTGIDDWCKVYGMRLRTFLSAMEKDEKEENAGSENLTFLLSTHMRESWKTGRFWLDYAAKDSWAFDTVFWKYLDQRFFGKRKDGVAKDNLWKTRVDLLSEKEREVMEPFVQWKMEDKTERILVDWDPEEAKKRFAELLFD